MVNTVEPIGHNMDVSNAVLFGIEDLTGVGMEEGSASSSSDIADGNNGESHVQCIEDIFE